jgi:predicted DNA binding CopG/RHH family protein
MKKLGTKTLGNSPMIGVRLPDDEYEKLVKRAAKAGMTLSEYVRGILTRAINHKG